MIAWLVGAAWAGSLDLLDVGGLWGTPLGSEPTAVWWNPAGVAAGRGTRFLIEGAPVLAGVTYDRDDPVWGGEQRYRYFGLAPFLGVATDASVPGLGLGAAFFVPVARGARAEDPDDPLAPGRAALREADIRVLSAALSASYQILGKVSIGASFNYFYGSWYADLDSEYATTLADELVVANGGTQTDYYPDDAIVEDPDYATRARFGALTAHNVGFGVGVHARPIPQLELGVSYQHGWYARHRGTAKLDFACPPDTDTVGRFGAEDRGLCFAEMETDAMVSYRYPKRVHFGVAGYPVANLRLEAFGGWVGWGTFKDFEISLSNARSLNTTITEETAGLLAKERLWARDNRDTFFVGLDGQYRLKEKWRFGLRAMLDRSAVPEQVLSPNNYDTDTIIVGAQLGFAPIRQVEVAISFTEKIGLARESTSQPFGMAVDPALRNEDRYFYPSFTGRYTSTIHRFGISLRFLIDGKDKRTKKAIRDAEEPS